MQDQVTFDHFLDFRGLRCPLPLLKLKQALHPMPAGTRIRVETSDAGSLRDVDAWCRAVGHTLLQAPSEADDSPGAVYAFLIETRTG